MTTVAEAAVVGAKDEVTGQAIIAYVTLRGDVEVDDHHGEVLRKHVADQIGAIARPKTIIFTPDLPKTRSGKIMRRLLRDVAEGRDLGDTTTLADATVVEEIRNRARPRRRRTSPLAESDHVGRNRSCWNELASGYAEAGRRSWASATPTWGVYEIEDGRVLDEVAGLDAVELGCGTAYVSAWLAASRAPDRWSGSTTRPRSWRRPGSCSRSSTSTSRSCRPMPSGFRCAPAAFDLAVSEYGAAIWCDPYRWIPEAARLLRPGGRLVFLGNSTLLMLCAPDEDDVPAATELLRPQRGMHRFEWPDDPGVEFHLSHGDMIRLLRTSGFEVQDLIELYPDAGATTTFALTPPSWAARWPIEEVWIARKRG